MPTLFLLLLTVATYAQPQPPLLDERDGKKYKTVKIGTQIWTAENLNYNAEGSKCYGNKQENCVKYGRLYEWETAMKSCPSGWHLPSNKEWKILEDFVGGDEGKKLKAKNGWNNNDGSNGTDEYGFSAMLGGGYSDDSFYDLGYDGSWWSSIEYSSYQACGRNMLYNDEYVYRFCAYKTVFLSVRCVKD